MINELQIKNYKSIDQLDLHLGRINVFIGENGAGKSNILEIIALAGAAVADKLDNEFLASRGIRVTKPEYMRSAFNSSSAPEPISVLLKSSSGVAANLKLSNDNSPYAKWSSIMEASGINLGFNTLVETVNDFVEARKKGENKDDNASIDELLEILGSLRSALLSQNDESSDNNSAENSLGRVPVKFSGSSNVAQKLASASMAESGFYEEFSDFVIFSPENSALRTFEREGQIEPLGINGEGLLKLLSVYSQSDQKSTPTLDKIKASLKLLDWFSDFKAVDSAPDRRLVIKDRYVDNSVIDFDHKSTNEGFFFLLFYFSLFTSELTPNFFAVDNIDASLNPKLCQKLMTEITKLAKENGKQAILTTHNPAILDGLDLDDDEQRLFVVSRARNGATKVKRIKKPIPLPGKNPQKLSSLFLSGMIGGVPKGF